MKFKFGFVSTESNRDSGMKMDSVSLKFFPPQNTEILDTE